MVAVFFSDFMREAQEQTPLAEPNNYSFLPFFAHVYPRLKHEAG